jgi:hypothetical protein
MVRRDELQNEFSWSLSQDTLFNTCLRRYYYHYYGSWNGWRYDAPPDIRELYLMKNLQTMPMWTGALVHHVAQEVVKGFGRGLPLPVEAALAMTRDQMERDWQDSISGRYRSRPNRICGLVEHYYDVSVPPEALHEAMVVAEGCVRRVYGTRSYQTMLELGPTSIVECEELNTVSVSGFKVWVSPDVIVRDAQGRLLIVDWKTGTSAQKQETERQLYVYAIYALQRHGASTEQLVGVEENLRLGEEHVYSLKEWALEEVRRYIQGSIASMRSLLYDRERNIALIRDFPMTDRLAACLDCRFRRACDRA